MNVQESGSKVGGAIARPMEWVYRQIVDSARDAVILADTDGVIRLWNSGAETVFGYRLHEAIGNTLDLIIPEPYRERHWAAFRNAVKSGVTKYAEGLLAVPGQRKDGTRISLELTMVLLTSAGGGVLGVAAIMRDVTRRWTRDQEVRQRLAELERHMNDSSSVGL